MSTTPAKKLRIYQDVDGVLNATFGHKAWNSRLGKGYARSGPDEYPIAWSPALVESLNGLDDIAERVWLTTWCADAEAQIAPLLGLSRGSRVLMPLSGEVSFPSIHWKLEALLADQKRDPSPFVWLDDEIDMPELAAITDIGGMAPVIEPNLGVRPADIEKIKTYYSTI